MRLWLSLVGVALQVVGLVIAMWGVSQTYEQAMGSSMSKDLWRRLRQWARRLLRRPEPATAKTVPVQAVAIGTATLRASARVSASDPGRYAPSWKQVQYLRRSVEILFEQDDEDRRYAEHERRELATGLRQRQDDLEARQEADIRELENRAEQTRDALWGTNGKGLQNAVVGLAITAAGVALTSAALPW